MRLGTMMENGKQTLFPHKFDTYQIGHTSRSRGTGYVPTPNEIKQQRGELTQTEAAAMIYTTQRRWSHYECGKSRMHPAAWELFLIKTTR